MLGDGTPPPKVLNWPKPASSSRMSTMFGAPFGGRTICGNVAGSESSISAADLTFEVEIGSGQ